MAATTHSSETSDSVTAPISRSRRSMLRLGATLILVAVGTGIGLWTFVWWSERGLRNIERHLDNGDYLAAMQAADRYLGRNPQDTRAEILKARALSGLHRHEDANALFERVAYRSNGFPGDRAALKAWAESLIHLKRWSQAETKLIPLLEADPADAEAMYRLTVVRMRLHKYEAAMTSAKRLLQLDGQADTANMLIGTINHDLGRRSAALAAWEKVLAGNPNAKGLGQLPPHEFLGRVGDEMLALGQPRRAAKVFERSLADRPTAAVYASLGRAYSQTNRPDDAIRAWKAALKLDARDRVAREELSNAALSRGNPLEAIEWLAPLKNVRQLSSTAAYLLQRSYAALKKPEEAAFWRNRTQELRTSERLRAELDHSLRENPNPFLSRYLVVYRFAAEGKWNDAKTAIEQLLGGQRQHRMVRELAAAIERRGNLPPLPRPRTHTD